jgi:hypothetical protein
MRVLRPTAAETKQQPEPQQPKPKAPPAKPKPKTEKKLPPCEFRPLKKDTTGFPLHAQAIATEFLTSRKSPDEIKVEVAEDGYWLHACPACIFSFKKKIRFGSRYQPPRFPRDSSDVSFVANTDKASEGCGALTVQQPPTDPKNPVTPGSYCGFMWCEAGASIGAEVCCRGPKEEVRKYMLKLAEILGDHFCSTFTVEQCVKFPMGIQLVSRGGRVVQLRDIPPQKSRCLAQFDVVVYTFKIGGCTLVGEGEEGVAAFQAHCNEIFEKPPCGALRVAIKLNMFQDDKHVVILDVSSLPHDSAFRQAHTSTSSYGVFGLPHLIRDLYVTFKEQDALRGNTSPATTKDQFHDLFVHAKHCGLMIQSYLDGTVRAVRVCDSPDELSLLQQTFPAKVAGELVKCPPGADPRRVLKDQLLKSHKLLCKSLHKQAHSQSFEVVVEDTKMLTMMICLKALVCSKMECLVVVKKSTVTTFMENQLQAVVAYLVHVLSMPNLETTVAIDAVKTFSCIYRLLVTGKDQNEMFRRSRLALEKLFPFLQNVLKYDVFSSTALPDRKQMSAFYAEQQPIQFGGGMVKIPGPKDYYESEFYWFQAQLMDAVALPKDTSERTSALHFCFMSVLANIEVMVLSCFRTTAVVSSQRGVLGFVRLELDLEAAQKKGTPTAIAADPRARTIFNDGKFVKHLFGEYASRPVGHVVDELLPIILDAELRVSHKTEGGLDLFNGPRMLHLLFKNVDIKVMKRFFGELRWFPGQRLFNKKGVLPRKGNRRINDELISMISEGDQEVGELWLTDDLKKAALEAASTAYKGSGSPHYYSQWSSLTRGKPPMQWSEAACKKFLEQVKKAANGLTLSGPVHQMVEDIFVTDEHRDQNVGIFSRFHLEILNHSVSPDLHSQLLAEAKIRQEVFRHAERRVKGPYLKSVTTLTWTGGWDVSESSPAEALRLAHAHTAEAYSIISRIKKEADEKKKQDRDSGAQENTGRGNEDSGNSAATPTLANGNYDKGNSRMLAVDLNDLYKRRVETFARASFDKYSALLRLKASTLDDAQWLLLLGQISNRRPLALDLNDLYKRRVEAFAGTSFDQYSALLCRKASTLDDAQLRLLLEQISTPRPLALDVNDLYERRVEAFAGTSFDQYSALLRRKASTLDDAQLRLLLGQISTPRLSPAFGLHNLGQTCYLNSILQCLFSTFCHCGVVPSLQPQTNSAGYNLIAKLHAAFQKSKDADEAVSPVDFWNALSTFDPKFKRKIQHDASEFFGCILNAYGSWNKKAIEKLTHVITTAHTHTKHTKHTHKPHTHTTTKPCAGTTNIHDCAFLLSSRSDGDRQHASGVASPPLR